MLTPPEREVWRRRTSREGSDGDAKVTDVKGEAFQDRGIQQGLRDFGKFDSLHMSARAF